MKLRHLFLKATLGLALLAQDVPGPFKERIVLVGDSTVASRSGWDDAFSKLPSADIECLNMRRGGRSSKSYRAGRVPELSKALKP